MPKNGRLKTKHSDVVIDYDEFGNFKLRCKPDGVRVFINDYSEGKRNYDSNPEGDPVPCIIELTEKRNMRKRPMSLTERDSFPLEW